jgi:hypothetical protein
VMERVEAGGHDVPDEKILTRFPRTFTNLRQALSFVNQAYYSTTVQQTSPIGSWRSSSTASGDVAKAITRLGRRPWIKHRFRDRADVAIDPRRDTAATASHARES